MKKIIIYFFISLALLVALSPKRHLYNFLESKLFESKIIISQEKLKESLFSLSIDGGNIYANDILSATFSNISIRPFIFFNGVEVSNLQTSKDIKDIFSMNVETAKLTHSIISPLKINIKAKGDFGEAGGFVDLKNRALKIEIFAAEPFAKQLEKLKISKNGEGVYVYESSY